MKAINATPQANGRGRALGTSFTVSGVIGLAIALFSVLGSSASGQGSTAARGVVGAGPGDCVDEFNVTGGPQNWRVPRGVTEITINAYGAQGGGIAAAPTIDQILGGNGAGVTGTVLPVNPGDQIEAIVGGRGTPAAGGFPDGGDGGLANAHAGRGGGGSSTVSHNGQEVVIAGGGGGATHGSENGIGGSGGDGGLNGEDGIGATTTGNAQPGLGATTTAGGAGGAGSTFLQPAAPGTAGSAGQGGTGGAADGPVPPWNGGSDGGGGGGGGLFGGGGGGGGDGGQGSGAGAGGGSSLAQPDSTVETGVKEGDGLVEIIRERSECRDPKLVLKKTTKKNVVSPGEVIPYRITVRNKGRGQALGVRVCDKLPSGLKLLRAPGSVKSNAKSACWKLERLRPGAKRTFKVVAQVKTSTGAGELPNSANVKGCNGARRCKDRDKEKVKVETAQDPCLVGRIAARC